ncbi:hypothetical protein [Phosphitispora sp. TUW77]|uniref:hypothetical protein n=1 Tax=Phosphitispora sp. TUW77 TaxID=3152361 RepID=UPI003AB47FAC
MGEANELSPKAKLSLRDGKQQLQKALRPSLRRVAIRHYIEWALRAFVCGLVAAAAILAVSRFVPIADSLFRSAAVGLMVVTVFLVRAWQKRPGCREAALAADQTGLSERAATAWEFRNSNDPFIVRQRDDALEFLKKMDYRGIPLWIKSLREFGTVLVLLLAVTVLAFYPNPMDKVAEARKQEQLALAEAKEDIRELRRQVAQDEEVPDDIKKQLDAELKKLEQELAEAGSLDKGAAALAKEEADIVRRFSQKETKSWLAEVAGMLKEKPLTAEAGKALEKGDLQKFKQQMEALGASVKELDAEERKSLDELKEQVVGQFAEALMADRLAADMQAALRRAKEGMLAMGSSGGKSQTAMAGTFSTGAGGSSAGNTGGNAIGTGNAGNAEGNVDGNAGSNNGGSSGGSAGVGTEGAAGEGAAGGTGSGSGSASASGAGSGAGTGSTNTDGGSHSAGEAGPGTDDYWGIAPENEGQYEVIYVPTRLGSDGRPEYVGGTPGDSGTSVSVDTENGPVTGGWLLPYSEVLTRYESEAMQGLEQQYVPDNMKDMVREYFMGLAGE